MKRTSALLLLSFALALACAAPAYAQSTTATLEGQVIDASGKVQANVDVIVRNLGTGLLRTDTTNANGRFTFPGLPPGKYAVEATSGEQRTAVIEQVLNIGRTVLVNLKLEPKIVEEVSVTASRPILNASDGEVSTVVQQQDIQNLPLINRDFTDLASLAPGAKPKQTGQVDPTKNEDIYRPFTIGAGNGREVSIQIDGGDNNDNAVGTWVQGYTAEAIQEFEVVTSQYKVEYGRASAGVVNVITKSGSNTFDGSLFGLYRDDGFRSKNFSEELANADKAVSERKQYGGSFGAPIVKDKLFVFGAYERIEEDSPTAYSPDLTQYARTASLAGRSFTTALERDLYTVKVNWNLSGNNTFFVRYSKDDNAFGNDQGGALLPEVYNGSSVNDVYSIVGNWTAVWGKALNEMTIHTNDFKNGIVSNTPATSLDFITNEAYDLISLGRNLNTPQATFQKKLQLRDDFTWSVGKHDLKAGIDLVKIDLDDSYLGLPDLPTVQFAFDTDVTPDVVDATPNDLALVDELSIANPGLIPATDYKQMALYVQDDWNISPSWTVYGGLRYDADLGIFDAQNEGINRTFYEQFRANAGSIFKDTFPGDQKHFSPRIGMVHRFKGQSTDVLRASWGVFYDKMIDNLVIFSRQNLSPVYYPSLPVLDCAEAGVVGTECLAGYDVDGPGGIDPLPADFTYGNWTDPNPANPLRGWFNDLVSTLGPLTTIDSQALFFPAPDWRTPHQRSFSVGWGHQFNNEWAMDLNGVYSRGYNQYRYWNLRGRNSGWPAFTTAAQENFFVTDGRSEYASIQTQFRGRTKNMDMVLNLNFSKAYGTQDSGASADESGTLDIFSGGNRRFTGPDPSLNPLCGTPGGPICVTESQEFGPVSGDQTIWFSMFTAYRFPWGIVLSGDLSYGSEIAFWPNAGYDWNRDGFNSASEYLGHAGSGRGDDFFQMNMRLTKNINLPKAMMLSVFAEVFNVTNQTNYGLFVDQTQAGAGGLANPTYETPTGNQVGPPRTYNVGLRFNF